MLGLFSRRNRPSPPDGVITVGGRREVTLDADAAAEFLTRFSRWQPVTVGLLFRGGPPAVVNTTDGEFRPVRIVVAGSEAA